jgi:ribosomal-protein-alanine N-acetyltransferase
LDEILRIEEASFPEPWTRGLFLSEIGKSPPTLFVARKELGAPIVGYLCFWTLAEEIHLLNLAVPPFFRKQGVGRLLMHFLLDAARKQGISRVLLEVRPSNKAALTLYQSLGFKTLYTRPSYYPPHNEEAWVMEWQP